MKRYCLHTALGLDRLPGVSTKEVPSNGFNKSLFSMVEATRVLSILWKPAGSAAFEVLEDNFAGAAVGVVVEVAAVGTMLLGWVVEEAPLCTCEIFAGGGGRELL
jgi:hypothetical protein